MTSRELYTKGARIWIPDADQVWRAAELLEDYKGQKQLKIQYEAAEDSTIEVSETKLPHLRNPDILIGENDLTSLSYLNEPEVLYNLRIRFIEQNTIYTYCGIVLVAINPYEALDIYGTEIIQAYSGQDMGAMDPHIFAVAEEAFKMMSRFEKNQSIIVSGESGAGKTVSAKYAMRYFATVGGSSVETQVERKVLASNPIMEAIGNAKTTRNDNSSRFGKYIEIGFDTRHEIIRASMRTYLLEKSRVVFQASEERNYHIFYQLCASSALPELEHLKLKSPDDFFYTSQGGAPDIDGVDDADDFISTREAFTTLGFAEKDQLAIFTILGAILHFGNVAIREKDGESCEIPKGDQHLTMMSKLLGIDESQMRMWLCNRQIQTVQETLTKPLTEKQASFARDALAKHIYSQLFNWIVAKVNKALQTSAKQHKFIGVLDIYGFETFEINSFEQFCINYANEKLQQIFNMHVFKLEQEEYVREEIEWSFISFYDNQPCIDLIEAKLGILDLLDEECRLPKGSDGNWCQKLYDKHSKSEHFAKPRMSNTAFIIHHFADNVTYQADGFLEKNRDTVLEEHLSILKASEMQFVAALFTEVDPNAKRGRSASQVTVQPLRQQPKQGSKQHRSTVGSQFRDSLKLLMDTLNATTPHYIRCIKPNDTKSAFDFDPKRAVEQLRACGVLETIRISAAGYPSRWTYAEFFQRYRVLAKSKHIIKKDMRKTCENILPALINDEDKYRFGKTKIFFRAGQVAYLEKLRGDKLKACGIMIQKHIRGWLQRRKYRRLRAAVVHVQRFGRGLLARRLALFMRQTRAATRIQARWRGHRQRCLYRNLSNTVVLIQARIRGLHARRRYTVLRRNNKAMLIQKQVRVFLERRRFKKVLRGVVKLQAHVRRRRAKRLLKDLKIEARSVAHIKSKNLGLENKIIELQQRLDERGKQVQQLQEQEAGTAELKRKVEELKAASEQAKLGMQRAETLEEQVRRLQAELEKEKQEKMTILEEKNRSEDEFKQQLDMLESEKKELLQELQIARSNLSDDEVRAGEELKTTVEAAQRQLMEEFNQEREHHQRLVREHNALQQRFDNLKTQFQVETSPTKGHQRNISDVSNISLESAAEVEREEDQGYETSKRRPPTELKLTTTPATPGVPADLPKDVDVGLVLKLQGRVKSLEQEKGVLQRRLEKMEEDGGGRSPFIPDSAFNALKQEMANADEVALLLKLQQRVRDLEAAKSKLTSELDERDEEDEDLIQTQRHGTAYHSLKMQELENENDKLKREVDRLMESIAKTPNFNAQGKRNPASEEFLRKIPLLRRVFGMDKDNQLKAMEQELEQRRSECLELRAVLADMSINKHSIAKESYGGKDDLVNEDHELETAYRSQKELNRLLQTHLEKAERLEKEHQEEIEQLRKENENLHKTIRQNLSLGPEAKIEATMQHEITRLTSENLDLRETIDEQKEQIRKLKKMLKVYAKRLKEGEAAEIAAELERDEQQTSVSNLAQVKHRERKYLGMLEYKKEDEGALVKNLILDLKPVAAADLLPGLPAYILFMCVRHTDYINDDTKVRDLLTNTVNGIKKVVKRHSDSLDRITLWLANSCRLLHTLKQYSGEKTFQNENTPKQNEQCLRNFDLSEYRAVFSDIAVWIYNSLLKLIEKDISPYVVPAILEHEAIAGLTSSKPTGLRGRSASNAHDLDEEKEKSLESLVKALDKYMKILNQHAVDPELIKQIVRQVFYFIATGALNNLLLRKDMCNWTKGMQIRYNLSHMEQWLRDNKLHDSGAQTALDPIVQASQLLQARKTDADVDSIVDMCDKLSMQQIVKILNLYTPADQYEERVPISFIRKIQDKLRDKQQAGSTLLMDTKYIFPVTFPFNPSRIALEELEVPQVLHLGFLKRI